MNISLEDLTTTEQDNTNIAALMLQKFIGRDDQVGQAAKPISVKVTGKDELLKRLQKHLSGELRLGLYDLLHDGTAQWAVVEFEDHSDDARTDEDACLANALKYQRRLEELSIPSMIERSKNPNGRCYHLHIRFDEPLSAGLVRDGLRAIGKQVFGTFPNEIFPKGDTGIGNFVWLPLFGGVEDVIYTKSGEPRRGGGVPGGRTVFLDDAGETHADQQAALVAWQSANAKLFAELVLPFVSLPSETVPGYRDDTGIEQNQPGLDKMEANCPIVKKWIENPVGWSYDHWLGLGSNYVPFKGGWERFVELSKKDAANFEQHEIDRICEEVLAFHGPQTYDKFREQGLELELPGNAPKAPAGWGSKYDPIDSPIVMQNGCYGKLGSEGVFRMLTPFTIEAGELLLLPDGDVLTCTVQHVTGQEWKDITIENTDWHTRGKLMKALKHSEATFHGSDLDAIDLCQHVVSKVQVRKQGTRSIGLVDDLWVVRGSNMTAAGQINPMQITPYDRSADSLHARVQYPHLNDADYADMVTQFFGNILDVNLPEVMLPILGWFFAAPLKPRIMKLVGSFPVLFCYGTPGGGKTSLLELMLSVHGYDDPTVYSCTMKEFPMLKLLSSTNAVPVVLDEYKPYDMREGQVMSLSRMLRKLYRGEIEDKGRQDQSVEHYHLQAPVVLCGEAKVKESAVLERVLIAGFTDQIKKNTACQTAFAALKTLDLQGFMARYIPFCLGVDVEARWRVAETATKAALTVSPVAPRILTNITAMTFGLQLMQDFAAQNNIKPILQLDLAKAVEAQIEEITGDGKGQVKLAIDMMLEQLALMAERDLAKKNIDFAFTKVRDLSSDKTYLAIHLKTAVQTFKANAFRIGYDGELLDDGAYSKQMKTRDYVKRTNHPTRFKSYNYGKDNTIKKCAIIDLDEAKASGLELVGFDTLNQECDDDGDSAKKQESKETKTSQYSVLEKM